MLKPLRAALSAALLAAWLGGCALINPAAAPSSTSSNPPATAASSNPLQTLASFTLADLQAADAMAKANKDTVADQCFAYLITQVPAAQAQLGSVAPSNVAGAFSAFEAGRTVVTNVQGFVNGVPTGLNTACAPLVLDAGGTLVGLAAKLGIALTLPVAAPGLLGSLGL